MCSNAQRRFLGFEVAQRFLHLDDERLERGRGEGDAGVEWGSAEQGPRESVEWEIRVLVCEVDVRLQLCCQRLLRGRGEDKRPGGRARLSAEFPLVDASIRARRFVALNNRVGVGAAEAEGINGAAFGNFRTQFRPFLCSDGDFEVVVEGLDRRVEFGEVHVWGNDAVLHGKRGFEQSCNTGGALGVADHCFD